MEAAQHRQTKSAGRKQKQCKSNQTSSVQVKSCRKTQRRTTRSTRQQDNKKHAHGKFRRPRKRGTKCGMAYKKMRNECGWIVIRRGFALMRMHEAGIQSGAGAGRRTSGAAASPCRQASDMTGARPPAGGLLSETITPCCCCCCSTR